MNPSSSHPEPPFHPPSSTQPHAAPGPSFHPGADSPSENNQSNLKNDTTVYKDKDFEDVKSRTDSFADDGSSTQDSVDVESLLSATQSQILNETKYQGRPTSEDYSALSDTSTCDGTRQTLTEGDLNLTDISEASSQASEATLTGESENDVSVNSERNSVEESYIVKDVCWEVSDGFQKEYSEKRKLLETGYDCNAEGLNDNIRYYSTILEESEEDDSSVSRSSGAFGHKLNMGQYHSSSSGGRTGELAKNKIVDRGTESSSRESSDGWRLSQSSTNTNLSSSTGGNSEDTLAENMSELSSINSHLSVIGDGAEIYRSLDKNERKYAPQVLREIKSDDPDATPVATPQSSRKDNMIIKNAINELENIEQTAQTLLQQSQAPPKPQMKKDVSCDTDLKVHKDCTTGNSPKENSVDLNSNKSLVGHNSEVAQVKENGNLHEPPVLKPKRAIKPSKPPVHNSSVSKSEGKTFQMAKPGEIKPFISRESYNEETILKEIETLRESYSESDLNDFLDKLGNSRVKDNMDERTFEQLLADIKADAERTKESSTESLHSVSKSSVKKGSTRTSQESLQSFSKTRSLASRKFEKLKERIFDLLYRKNKVKGRNVDDSDLSDNSRPLTPTSAKNIDGARSRSKTPEVPNLRSPTPDSSNKPEEKKSFKITEFIRKESSKLITKFSGEESHSPKTSVSGTDKEMKSQINKENNLLSKPDTGDESKGNLNNDLKKEVRFNLNLEEVSSSEKSANIEQFKSESNQNDSSKNAPSLPLKQKAKEPAKSSQEKDQTKSDSILVTNEEAKKKENNHDLNIEVENLLPKLPERVRPPRRRKKKVMPATVENTSRESYESSSQRSSDDSHTITPKNSLLIESTTSEETVNCTEANSGADKQFQNNDRLVEAEIHTLQPIKEVTNQTSLQVVETCNEEAKTNLKVTPSIGENFNKVPDLTKVPVITLDECKTVSEHKDLEGNDKVPESSETEFVKETTPAFPDPEDTEVSFYDNVNPYFELMTKLQEEEEEETVDPSCEISTKPNLQDPLRSIENTSHAPNQEKMHVIEKNYTNEDKIEYQDTKLIEGGEDNVLDDISLKKMHLVEKNNRNEEKIENQDMKLKEGGVDNVLNSISFSQGVKSQEDSPKSPQEARESLEHENHLDELNYLTEEMARIADDMERDMDVARNQTGFDAKIHDKNKTTNGNTEKTPHEKHLNSKPISTIRSQTGSSKMMMFRKHESTSQTDSEYDETDLDAESEVEEKALPAKQQIQYKHFFSSSTAHTRNGPPQNTRKPPAAPPRQFQQKMPLKVVNELKSVLSNNEETRSKVPAVPPRWNSIPSSKNGRCSNDKTDAVGHSDFSSSLSAKHHLNTKQTTDIAADLQVKPSLPLPLIPNQVVPSNSVAPSILKTTKPNKNEKLDRRRSCSLSTENLAPIPEEAPPVTDGSSLERTVVPLSFKSAFINEGRRLEGKALDDLQKASIFRVRANVYPCFDPLPKPLQSKPPTNPLHNNQNKLEDGYVSDPGSQNYKSSLKSKFNDSGYATDSEVLHRNKNVSKNSLMSNKNTSSESRTQGKGVMHERSPNLDVPPPRPPPPLEEKLVTKTCNWNRRYEQRNSLPSLNDIIDKINESLRQKIHPPPSVTMRPENRIKMRSNSLELTSLSSYPEKIKHKPVTTPFTQEQTNIFPQSITLSSSNPCEKLHTEEKKNEAKFGTQPEDKLSYLTHKRDRPLTWCPESDFQTSPEQYNNSEMVVSTPVKEPCDIKVIERSDKECLESRPSSQSSQCSSQRLQAQGLGEWLFLARLDHTNQLLSQLNSTMQLRPDCSPSEGSDHCKKSYDHINENSVHKQRRSPPAPPPRPRTPIDERDPEQVLSERRYLSYFQGPPHAKHSPGKEESPKSPSFQQIEAQKRYSNYFIGPPKPNPEKQNTTFPDLENDEEVLEARKRYMAYFDKGPPRPKSCSESTQQTDDDEETIRARERYKSYFHSTIPRSRSVGTEERTPEPDEKQKAAEQRYLSYFHPGPPRPRSTSRDVCTPEPDEEQIAAEKRYMKYFEGFPKSKHDQKEDGSRPSITAEMVAAEERLMKYFQPIPHGAPRKVKPLPPPTEEETKKRQLFVEFQKALDSRVSRKQMKIVKVSKPKKEREREKTPPTLRDIVVEEFLQKVQERKKEKDLHFGDTDDEEEEDITEPLPKTLSSEEPIIQGGGTVDKRISIDLQLFVGDEEVWSPTGGSQDITDGPSKIETSALPSFKDVPPVWTPGRAGSASPSLGRKEYNKIKFEGTTMPRKSQENIFAPKPEESFAWKGKEVEKLQSTFSSSTSLPRVQSPTVTLLQKRREGQIPEPRPNYLQNEESFYKPGDKLYTIKREYESEDEDAGSRKFAVLGPKKFEGVGPTTRDGVPIALKSGVKSEHQGEWYRRMFDSLHKVKDPRFSGYMSEPDGYDSDYGSRYVSLDRRNNKFEVDVSDAGPRNTKRYVHQPGRIENYVPGFSSLSEKELRDNPEADVKLEIKPQGHGEPPSQQRYGSGRRQMSHGLKESGYESDSTLVFKKREDQRRKFLDPKYSSVVYRQVQQGGEIPLSGLQKPAPPKPKESPFKYSNSEVNIHYRTPVRFEQKETLTEEELARRQQEHMKKVYEQERRKKYLAELEDIERRRHTDNFTPLQKSPIPLNRYDDESFGVPIGAKTPEPRQVAKALFNFTAQNKRELSFTKGDIVTIRRPIDRNWFEGELRGSVGIFPGNYVEVAPLDSLKSLGSRKPTEGQARTRFNFQAQTAMEMSLTKGEIVILTRRVDENWYEGRIGNRRGIFPVSYVDVLREPGSDRPISPSRDPFPRPALPAAHLLYNGTSGMSSPYPSMGRSASQNETKPLTQLTVNTQQDPVPYRALYNYKPQNEDELELIEGDIVFVMEKCDDGWFVGTSKRTGLFGTFPGNYVESS